MRKRWAEYLEQLLNVDDVGKESVNVVGGFRIYVIGGLNERAISIKRKYERLLNVNAGKAPRMDFHWSV